MPDMTIAQSTASPASQPPVQSPKQSFDNIKKYYIPIVICLFIAQIFICGNIYGFWMGSTAAKVQYGTTALRDTFSNGFDPFTMFFQIIIYYVFTIFFAHIAALFIPIAAIAIFGIGIQYIEFDDAQNIMYINHNDTAGLIGIIVFGMAFIGIPFFTSKPVACFNESVWIWMKSWFMDPASLKSEFYKTKCEQSANMSVGGNASYDEPEDNIPTMVDDDNVLENVEEEERRIEPEESPERQEMSQQMQQPVPEMPESPEEMPELPEQQEIQQEQAGGLYRPEDVEMIESPKDYTLSSL